MFKYTLDNKRYHTFNYFLRNKFGCKVFKVPLDAHATCPNKINGGCIFCKDNSKSNITNENNDIITQFNEEIKLLNKKWPNAKHIAYLQTGSNTYMNIDKFKNIVESLLKQDNVVGISIATRPDVISDEYYNYFEKLNKKTFLTVELGLQSSNENTLKLINRGHDTKSFENAVNKLHKLNIFVVAHIINGLPYETKEDMLNTVKFLNNLKVDAVKIHMLHILKGTKIENLYEKDKFHILSKEEFVKQMLKKSNFNTLEEAYENIGFGSVSPLKVVNKLEEAYSLSLNPQEELKVKNTLSKTRNNENDMVIVENIPNCKVKFAKCCLPIPGDDIIGYITFSNGVSIHRKDCKNLNNLDTSSRVINVSWKPKNKAYFAAKIRVKANNRDGLISDLIKVAKDLKINISEMNTKVTEDREVIVELVVDVSDTETLQKIMKSLKKVDSVFDTKRIH